MIQARLRRWLVSTLGGTLAFLVCSSIAHGYAVIVPDDYPTIQAAADFHEIDPEVDTIFVSPGIVEDSVYVLANSELAIVGLGDSLMGPRIRTMLVSGTSYWLVSLRNLRFTGEFNTPGKANILFESCRIEGGLASPTGGDLRELAFRHCVVTSRMVFGRDSFVDVDSCRFVAGSVRKEREGVLTVKNSSFDGPSPMVAIDGWDDLRLSVQDVRITGYAYGIQHVGNSATVEAHSNHIEDCGTGISLRIDGGRVAGNTIVGSSNDGLVCVTEGYGVEIERNVVLGSGRRGIVLEGYERSENRVLSNTVSGNQDAGFELQLHSSPNSPATALVTNNIGYGNHVGLRASGDTSGLQMSCNDWFANDSAAVVGVAPSATEVFVDPQFCDLAEHDVHLVDSSPLVDAPGCGLIGALGVGCANTATLVTWFTADRTADGVRIVWRLADDRRFGDVWLERSESRTDLWERVGGPESREGYDHVTVDRSVHPDRFYAYRLVALEDGRTLVLGEPIEVPATAFALGPISPNPARGPLRIEFSLAREAPVDLDVFDVAGRHVTGLVQGTRAAGPHSIEWAGDRAPGLYLVRYRYPGGATTRRVVRL